MNYSCKPKTITPSVVMGEINIYLIRKNSDINFQLKPPLEKQFSPGNYSVLFNFVEWAKSQPPDVRTNMGHRN